ncbi:hypothetical protein BsWGS_19722 [Bradybaena similaris]
MELYTMHIVCSIRTDTPYILLEKDEQKCPPETDEAAGDQSSSCSPSQELQNSDSGCGEGSSALLSSADLDRCRHSNTVTTCVKHIDRSFGLLEKGKHKLQNIIRKFVYEDIVNDSAVDSDSMFVKSITELGCGSAWRTVEGLCMHCLQNSEARFAAENLGSETCAQQDQDFIEPFVPFNYNVSQNSSVIQNHLKLLPHLMHTQTQAWTNSQYRYSLLTDDTVRSQAGCLNCIQHGYSLHQDLQLNMNTFSLSEKQSINLHVGTQFSAKHLSGVPGALLPSKQSVHASSGDVHASSGDVHASSGDVHASSGDVHAPVHCHLETETEAMPFIDDKSLDGQVTSVDAAQKNKMNANDGKINGHSLKPWTMFEASEQKMSSDIRKLLADGHDQEGCVIEQSYCPETVNGHTPTDEHTSQSQFMSDIVALSGSVIKQSDCPEAVNRHTPTEEHTSQSQCTSDIVALSGSAVNDLKLCSSTDEAGDDQTCDDQTCDVVCMDLPLTNFGFYSGEVTILM